MLKVKINKQINAPKRFKKNCIMYIFLFGKYRVSHKTLKILQNNLFSRTRLCARPRPIRHLEPLVLQ